MKSHEIEIEEPDDQVGYITNRLQVLGHPRPNDWTRYLAPEASNMPDKNYQRFLINRALRHVLGNCTTTNTMDARYCVIDQCNFRDWSKSFNEGVGPVLVKLCLPPAIN